MSDFYCFRIQANCHLHAAVKAAARLEGRLISDFVWRCLAEMVRAHGLDPGPCDTRLPNGRPENLSRPVIPDRRANAATAMPVEELSKLIRYDSDTGRFTWKTYQDPSRSVKPGMEAGSISRSGYRYIRVNGLHYSGHALAWYLHYKQWPTKQIDHENMDRADNRIDNLREATGSQQQGNRRVLRNGRGAIPRGSATFPLGGTLPAHEFAHVIFAIAIPIPQKASAYPASH